MFRLTFYTVLSSTPCSVEMNIWIVFFVIGLEMILSVDRALNIKCFCCCCCCFNICIVPLGFLLLENSGRFPRGKAAATESRYPTYSACWVILVFPSIHRALTWDYRIFYVRVWGLCACVCTRDLGLESHPKDSVGLWSPHRSWLRASSRVKPCTRRPCITGSRWALRTPYAVIISLYRSASEQAPTVRRKRHGRDLGFCNLSVPFFWEQRVSFQWYCVFRLMI